MSFIARTHPQQGPNEAVDDRQTLPETFAAFHRRFGFTVDAAASDHNAQLPRYWTREINGLAQSWAGERVWCNPPYSNIRPWVEKAAKLEAEIAVLLPPNPVDELMAIAGLHLSEICPLVQQLHDKQQALFGGFDGHEDKAQAMIDLVQEMPAVVNQLMKQLGQLSEANEKA